MTCAPVDFGKGLQNVLLLLLYSVTQLQINLDEGKVTLFAKKMFLLGGTKYLQTNVFMDALM